MKLIIAMISCVLLLSCQPNNNLENLELREEILHEEFTNSEVKSIEIVGIDHPMLGGINSIYIIKDEQIDEFLSDFDRLEKKGIYKCMSKFVIRINLESKTLRLKVCGNLISNRMDDMYYSLPGEVSLINKYLKK